jgi:hypothetical protein
LSAEISLYNKFLTFVLFFNFYLDSAQHQNLINNNQQNIINNNNNSSKTMTTNSSSNIASIKMHLDQPNHNHNNNDKNDDDSDKNSDHSLAKRQSFQLPAAKAKLEIGNKNEKKIPHDGEMKTKKVADTNNVKSNEKKSNCSSSVTMTVTSNVQQTMPPLATMQQRIATAAAPLSDGKAVTIGDKNQNRFQRRLIEGGDRKELLQNVGGTLTVTTITPSTSNKTKGMCFSFFVLVFIDNNIKALTFLLYYLIIIRLINISRLHWPTE